MDCKMGNDGKVGERRGRVGDGDGAGEGTVVLRVAFRHASPSWDEDGVVAAALTSDGGNSNDDNDAPPLPLPAKASSLPHGAEVALELLRRLRPSKSNSSGGGCGRGGGPDLEVRSWRILRHPGGAALHRATTEGGGSITRGGCGGGGGGILCSAYLKSRETPSWAWPAVATTTTTMAATRMQ